MNCPECGSNQVQCVDSRDKETHVRRRRECLDCLTRFSTIEISLDDYKKLTEQKKGNKT